MDFFTNPDILLGDKDPLYRDGTCVDLHWSKKLNR